MKVCINNWVTQKSNAFEIGNVFHNAVPFWWIRIDEDK
jgi:hypothetical protein